MYSYVRLVDPVQRPVFYLFGEYYTRNRIKCKIYVLIVLLNYN